MDSAMDKIFEAVSLYDEYVQLAHISEFLPEVHGAEFYIASPAPLGLVIGEH